MNAPHFDSIDAYIGSFPKEIQARLRQVYKVLRAVAPDATEAIKYQMPTFVLGENLIHFAAFHNHIGLYPTPSGITAFKPQLSSYVHSKGAVQFPHDHPLPTGLIQEIAEFRVREVRAKIGKSKSATARPKSTPLAPAKPSRPAKS